MNERGHVTHFEAPAQTPEGLFAAHVDHAREHGSVLTEDIRLSRLLPLAFAPPLMALAELGLEDNNDPTLAFIGFTAGTFAIVYGGFKHNTRKLAKRQAEQQEVQRAVGGEFELLTVRSRDPETAEVTRDVIMRLGNPTSYEYRRKPRKFIEKMAVLAENNGIGRVLFNDTVATMAGLGKGLETRSMERVLRDKARPVERTFGTGNNFKHDRVYELTPGELAGHIQHVTGTERRTVNVETEQIRDPLGWLIARLEQARGNHPLVGIYNASQKIAKPNLEKRDAMLLEAARSEINMRFSSTERQADAAIRTGRYAGEAPKNASGQADVARMPPKARKVAVSGDVTNSSNVAMFVDGAYDTSVQLASSLGITPDALRVSLEKPDIDPRTTAKVIEYLMWHYLKDGLKPEDFYKGIGVTPPKETVVSQVEVMTEVDRQHRYVETRDYVLRPMLHEEDVEHGTYGVQWFRGLRIVQSVGLAAAVAVGIAVPRIVENTMESHTQTARIQTAAQMERELGLSPGSISPDGSEVLERARDESRAVDYWHTFKGGRASVVDAVSVPLFFDKDPLPFNDNPSATSSRLWGVGNAEKGPIHDDYEIMAHNGMETQGYWSTATSSRLMIVDNERLEWESERLITDDSVLAPKELDSNQASLEVWRTVAYDDYEYMSAEVGLAIKVPIRQGTKLAAANIDGKPVIVYLQPNGTYALQMPKGNITAGKLTYWLVPDESIKPHAITALNWRAETDDTRTIWDQEFPGLPAEDNARARALAAKIKENYSYDMTAGQGEFDGVVEWSKIIAQGDKAQCTVESTVVALNSPIAINVVTGYLNKGKSNRLSTNELHMWPVNRVGEIMDGSPYKNIPADQKRYLNDESGTERPGYPQLPVPGPLVLLGSLAALATLSRRKQLVQKVDQVRSKYAGRAQVYVENTSKDRLALAVAAAGQIAYGSAANLSAETTKAQAAASRTTAAADASRILQPDFHTEEVQNGVHQLRRQAPMRDKLAFVRASNVVRAARHSTWQAPHRKSIIMNSWMKASRRLNRK